MRERVWTIVLVSIVSLTIWLFAEAESLGSFSDEARVQFQSPANGDRVVRPEGFAGLVDVEIRGPRGDISRARDVLGAGVRLSPDDAGIGTAEGRVTVNLLAALQRYKPLTDTGVEIVSVRPQSVDVGVTVLEERVLPVVVFMPTVEVVGPVRILPEGARVRVPRGSVPSGAGGGGGGGSEAHRVIARPTPQQLRSLPPSGAARLQDVPLELPEALLGADSTLLDRGAAVEFTIRNRNATRDLTLVPVQVVLPPIETERWRVRVDEEDEFVTVSLAGPADALDAIASGTDRAVAVLALSSDDLEAMVTSKDISVFLLRGGVVTPLPAGVQATPSKRSVRFEVQPLPASPGP